ncbi:unnamed protein product [Owenia fusiformis]|uniref:Uncharacterized protein n=1 Tax=Owenia fusiformis TaxID=6347 RepID=A0A8J1TYL7_OWEFU|nr:unnamed protein product [Owenia fusiformis]
MDHTKNYTMGTDITPISTALTTSYLKTGFSTEPTDDTILDRFKRYVEASPDKEALVIADVDTVKREAISFKDCDDLSDNLAANLIKEGVEINDVIAILMPNCKEFIVSWLSLLKCHAYPAFVSFNMRKGDDLKNVLNELKAVGVILHTGRSEGFYRIIKDVFGRLLDFKQDPDVPNLKFVVAIGTCLDGALPYINMVRTTTELELQPLHERVATITMDSPCAILQTSGSSGHPKLVVHRHFGMVNSFNCVAIRLNMSSSDRYFCDRPMTWGAGLFGLAVACIVGLTVITVDTTMSVAGRDIHSILQIISKEKCTRGLMMPYMLYDMLELPSVRKYQLDAFTKFWTSGQRIPNALLEGVNKTLPKASMIIGYGSTEMLWVSSQLYNVASQVDQTGTIGYPFPGFEIKITDGDDKVVPIGTPGNIKLRSYQMFTGYYNDDKKTKEKMKDGWFDVEDFGYLTEKGYLVFISKTCDMIKRGTVLVAPASVENVILNHPSVNNVIVVGVPDPRLYEELCACVILNHGDTTTEKAIVDFCNENLTEQTLDGLALTPKFVIIMEEFPRLPNGKPDKTTLKKIAADKCAI